MMSPTNLCLLLCLSVHYVTSASSEVNNEEVVGYVRKDLNNLNSLLDESNNRNALDENVNLEKTVDNNNLLNSLSSSNLLNKLNVQVHSSDLDDTNSLRNLRSNLKSVNGDFPNPLNYLNNVNLLSNSHGLEGVNNPVEDRSAVVNRNGQNPYEDGSSLSALLALNRLGVTSNRVGGLAGLNVLARNGVSSSVDLNGLGNVNLRTTYELNRLSGNRRSDLNNLELNSNLNQLGKSDSLNTVERNNLDELADDLLGDKSTQVLSASLNKLKEDNRRGLLKPLKLAKEQLLGRSGNGLDEDNLLNALESHNEGELNALSALATISNLNDNDYQNNLKSSKSLLESNNLVNNAFEVSSVESEADNLNELENLNKTPESLLNEADSSELESRYPEEEVNEVNTRRSGYLNNELLNSLRLLYGRNRGLSGSAQILPYSRPVSNNPYEYYSNLPLNPYLLNNQRNVAVSPISYMLRGRSGLKTNNNLDEDEELSTGLVEDKDSNDNDENRADNLEELQDYNVDNLLDSLNNDNLNGLSLGKNSVLLRNSQKQNQANVNDFDNRATLLDTNNVNDLSLLDVETLSGRRMGPFETLNPNLGVNANDANLLRNLGNLNSLRRQNEKNSDLSPVGLNKNSARDKLAKLHAVLRLTEEEELTLDEAKQLLAKGLRRPERRHF